MAEREMSATALVLLSGGMDSVAALHWAREERYRDVLALGFWYGQPQAHYELAAARGVAEQMRITMYTIHLGEGVRGDKAIVAPKTGVDPRGISFANLPLRNAVFLATAAAFVGRCLPPDTGDVDLVLAVNATDAERFPDCRKECLIPLWRGLSLGLAGIRELCLALPWVHYSKAEVLGWAAKRPEALAHVRDHSISCYAEVPRCGSCDACQQRAEAFRANGLEEMTTPLPPPRGGDPARDAKLGSAAPSEPRPSASDRGSAAS